MQTALPQLVLLPGLDGTGELFASIETALQSEIQTNVVRYSARESTTYSELLRYVCEQGPEADPFVILAESFSTPLAIRWAASCPPGLKGLILCAGFARSPVTGWKRTILSCFAPFVFRLRIPQFVLRTWLVGADTPVGLVETVRKTIASVSSPVLVERLREVLSCDAVHELHQIGVPIHYIRASRDRLVPPSSLNEIRRIRPDVAVSDVVGPHLILQAEPQRCAQLVTAIIRNWA